MNAAEILQLLQVDLGEYNPSDERAAYLTQAINAAIQMIAREGITLTTSAEDMQLVEMYAAYFGSQTRND